MKAVIPRHSSLMTVFGVEQTYSINDTIGIKHPDIEQIQSWQMRAEFTIITVARADALNNPNLLADQDQ